VYIEDLMLFFLGRNQIVYCQGELHIFALSFHKCYSLSNSFCSCVYKKPRSFDPGVITLHLHWVGTDDTLIDSWW